MARTEFDKKVRRDAFVRAGGFCEGLVEGQPCGCRLTVGKFAYDHRIPDWMGGEATLENCQVLCTPCHTVKTRQDAADRAKAKRREDAHRGIADAPRQKIRSAGFRKAPKRHPATAPVDKLAGLPRNTFTEPRR
ncbi:HNH endonuclease [Methylobacterium organophilum]|nr:HNH endonuclease [Methylobacterium organophilum]